MIDIIGQITALSPSSHLESPHLTLLPARVGLGGAGADGDDGDGDGDDDDDMCEVY